MGKVLVTGGCGFIGSHTIVDLIDNGYEVIAADSNIRSSDAVLDGIEKTTGVRVKNYKVDLTNLAALRDVFEEHFDITGVIHFAALKNVGESVHVPLWYHHNNFNSTLNVLKCIRDYKVKNLIFSSSCSVYGNADELPVTETTPIKEAESPYARTKQVGEYLIRDFANAYKDINTILLRYFNPGGAHPSGHIGETPFGRAGNLIPIITEVAAGKRKKLTVFGDDYDTRDGSCVRDYIHVMDLANAHTKCLQYLESGKAAQNCDVFNVGIGQGVTVLEAINAFEKVSGQKLNYEVGGRREGDVIAIYANYEKAAKLLGWQPKYDIEDIMRTAWAWEDKK